MRNSAEPTLLVPDAVHAPSGNADFIAPSVQGLISSTHRTRVRAALQSLEMGARPRIPSTVHQM